MVSKPGACDSCKSIGQALRPTIFLWRCERPDSGDAAVNFRSLQFRGYAARADAAEGLIDVRRLSEMLARIRGRIVHSRPDHLSPFSVSVMLEIGRERASGESAGEMILMDAAEDLIAETIA